METPLFYRTVTPSPGTRDSGQNQPQTSGGLSSLQQVTSSLVEEQETPTEAQARLLVSAEDLPKYGLKEWWQDTGVKGVVIDNIPFLGVGLDIAHAQKVKKWASSYRVFGEDSPYAELLEAEISLRERQRNMTGVAKVVSGALMLPGFALEVAVTGGGFSAAARTGTRATLKGLTKQGLKATLAKRGVANLSDDVLEGLVKAAGTAAASKTDDVAFKGFSSSLQRAGVGGLDVVDDIALSIVDDAAVGARRFAPIRKMEILSRSAPDTKKLLADWAAGNASTGRLLKGSGEIVLKTAPKSLSAPFAPFLGGTGVQRVQMSLPALRAAEGTIRDMTDQYGIDENGYLEVFKKGAEWHEALWRNIGNTSVEFFTEGMGDAFFIGRALAGRRFYNHMSEGLITTVLRGTKKRLMKNGMTEALAKKQTMNAVFGPDGLIASLTGTRNNFVKNVFGVHSIPAEVGEEWLGQLIRGITRIDESGDLLIGGSFSSALEESMYMALSFGLNPLNLFAARYDSIQGRIERKMAPITEKLPERMQEQLKNWDTRTITEKDSLVLNTLEEVDPAAEAALPFIQEWQARYKDRQNRTTLEFAGDVVQATWNKLLGNRAVETGIQQRLAYGLDMAVHDLVATEGKIDKRQVKAAMATASLNTFRSGNRGVFLSVETNEDRKILEENNVIGEVLEGKDTDATIAEVLADRLSTTPNADSGPYIDLTGVNPDVIGVFDRNKQLYALGGFILEGDPSSAEYRQTLAERVQSLSGVLSDDVLYQTISEAIDTTKPVNDEGRIEAAFKATYQLFGNLGNILDEQGNLKQSAIQYLGLMKKAADVANTVAESSGSVPGRPKLYVGPTLIRKSKVAPSSRAKPAKDGNYYGVYNALSDVLEDGSIYVGPTFLPHAAIEDSFEKIFMSPGPNGESPIYDSSRNRFVDEDVREYLEEFRQALGESSEPGAQELYQMLSTSQDTLNEYQALEYLSKATKVYAAGFRPGGVNGISISGPDSRGFSNYTAMDEILIEDSRDTGGAWRFAPAPQFLTLLDQKLNGRLSQAASVMDNRSDFIQDLINNQTNQATAEELKQVAIQSTRTGRNTGETAAKAQKKLKQEAEKRAEEEAEASAEPKGKVRKVSSVTPFNSNTLAQAIRNFFTPMARASIAISRIRTVRFNALGNDLNRNNVTAEQILKEDDVVMELIRENAEDLRNDVRDLYERRPNAIDPNAPDLKVMNEPDGYETEMLDRLKQATRAFLNGQADRMFVEMFGDVEGRNDIPANRRVFISAKGPNVDVTDVPVVAIRRKPPGKERKEDVADSDLDPFRYLDFFLEDGTSILSSQVYDINILAAEVPRTPTQDTGDEGAGQQPSETATVDEGDRDTSTDATSDDLLGGTEEGTPDDTVSTTDRSTDATEDDMFGSMNDASPSTGGESAFGNHASMGDIPSIDDKNNEEVSEDKVENAAYQAEQRRLDLLMDSINKRFATNVGEFLAGTEVGESIGKVLTNLFQTRKQKAFPDNPDAQSRMEQMAQELELAFREFSILTSSDRLPHDVFGPDSEFGRELGEAIERSRPNFELKGDALEQDIIAKTARFENWLLDQVNRDLDPMIEMAGTVSGVKRFRNEKLSDYDYAREVVAKVALFHMYKTSNKLREEARKGEKVKARRLSKLLEERDKLGEEGATGIEIEFVDKQIEDIKKGRWIDPKLVPVKYTNLLEIGHLYRSNQGRVIGVQSIRTNKFTGEPYVHTLNLGNNLTALESLLKRRAEGLTADDIAAFALNMADVWVGVPSAPLTANSSDEVRKEWQVYNRSQVQAINEALQKLFPDISIPWRVLDTEGFIDDSTGVEKFSLSFGLNPIMAGSQGQRGMSILQELKSLYENKNRSEDEQRRYESLVRQVRNFFTGEGTDAQSRKQKKKGERVTPIGAALFGSVRENFRYFSKTFIGENGNKTAAQISPFLEQEIINALSKVIKDGTPAEEVYVDAVRIFGGMGESSPEEMGDSSSARAEAEKVMTDKGFVLIPPFGDKHLQIMIDMKNPHIDVQSLRNLADNIVRDLKVKGAGNKVETPRTDQEAFRTYFYFEPTGVRSRDDVKNPEHFESTERKRQSQNNSGILPIHRDFKMAVIDMSEFDDGSEEWKKFEASFDGAGILRESTADDFSYTFGGGLRRTNSKDATIPKISLYKMQSRANRIEGRETPDGRETVAMLEKTLWSTLGSAKVLNPKDPPKNSHGGILRDLREQGREAWVSTWTKNLQKFFDANTDVDAITFKTSNVKLGKNSVPVSALFNIDGTIKAGPTASLRLASREIITLKKHEVTLVQSMSKPAEERGGDSKDIQKQQHGNTVVIPAGLLPDSPVGRFMDHLLRFGVANNLDNNDILNNPRSEESRKEAATAVFRLTNQAQRYLKMGLDPKEVGMSKGMYLFLTDIIKRETRLKLNRTSLLAGSEALLPGLEDTRIDEETGLAIHALVHSAAKTGRSSAFVDVESFEQLVDEFLLMEQDPEASNKERQKFKDSGKDIKDFIPRFEVRSYLDMINPEAIRELVDKKAGAEGTYFEILTSKPDERKPAKNGKPAVESSGDAIDKILDTVTKDEWRSLLMKEGNFRRHELRTLATVGQGLMNEGVDEQVFKDAKWKNDDGSWVNGYMIPGALHIAHRTPASSMPFHVPVRTFMRLDGNSQISFTPGTLQLRKGADKDGDADYLTTQNTTAKGKLAPGLSTAYITYFSTLMDSRPDWWLSVDVESQKNAMAEAGKDLDALLGDTIDKPSGAINSAEYAERNESFLSETKLIGISANFVVNSLGYMPSLGYTLPAPLGLPLKTSETRPVLEGESGGRQYAFDGDDNAFMLMRSMVGDAPLQLVLDALTTDGFFSLGLTRELYPAFLLTMLRTSHTWVVPGDVEASKKGLRKATKETALRVTRNKTADSFRRYKQSVNNAYGSSNRRAPYMPNDLVMVQEDGAAKVVSDTTVIRQWFPSIAEKITSVEDFVAEYKRAFPEDIQVRPSRYNKKTDRKISPYVLPYSFVDAQLAAMEQTPEAFTLDDIYEMFDIAERIDSATQIHKIAELVGINMGDNYPRNLREQLKELSDLREAPFSLQLLRDRTRTAPEGTGAEYARQFNEFFSDPRTPSPFVSLGVAYRKRFDALSETTIGDPGLSLEDKMFTLSFLRQAGGFNADDPRFLNVTDILEIFRYTGDHVDHADTILDAWKEMRKVNSIALANNITLPSFTDARPELEKQLNALKEKYKGNPTAMTFLDALSIRRERVPYFKRDGVEGGRQDIEEQQWFHKLSLSTSNSIGLMDDVNRGYEQRYVEAMGALDLQDQLFFARNNIVYNGSLMSDNREIGRVLPDSLLQLLASTPVTTRSVYPLVGPVDGSPEAINRAAEIYSRASQRRADSLPARSPGFEYFFMRLKEEEDRVDYIPYMTSPEWVGVLGQHIVENQVQTYVLGPFIALVESKENNSEEVQSLIDLMTTDEGGLGLGEEGMSTAMELRNRYVEEGDYLQAATVENVLRINAAMFNQPVDVNLKKKRDEDEGDDRDGNIPVPTRPTVPPAPQTTKPIVDTPPDVDSDLSNLSVEEMASFFKEHYGEELLNGYPPGVSGMKAFLQDKADVLKAQGVDVEAVHPATGRVKRAVLMTSEEMRKGVVRSKPPAPPASDAKPTTLSTVAEVKKYLLDNFPKAMTLEMGNTSLDAGPITANALKSFDKNNIKVSDRALIREAINEVQAEEVARNEKTRQEVQDSVDELQEKALREIERILTAEPQMDESEVIISRGEQRPATVSQARTLRRVREFLTSPNEREIAIAGAAGTGKSTIAQTIAEQFVKVNGGKAMIFSSSMHAANQVTRRKIIESGNPNVTVDDVFTISSLLGKKRERTSGVFAYERLSQKAEDTWKRASLMIIDEASRVGKGELVRLRQLANQNGVKIIFMGDHVQSLPIGETSSPVFETEDISTEVLTDVMRQQGQNPVLELATTVRVFREFGLPPMRQFTSMVREDGVVDVLPQGVGTIPFAEMYADQGVPGEATNANETVILTYTNRRKNMYNDILLRDFYGQEKGLGYLEPGMQMVSRSNITSGQDKIAVFNGQVVKIVSVGEEKAHGVYTELRGRDVTIIGDDALPGGETPTPVTKFVVRLEDHQKFNNMYDNLSVRINQAFNTGDRRLGAQLLGQREGLIQEVRSMLPVYFNAANAEALNRGIKNGTIDADTFTLAEGKGVVVQPFIEYPWARTIHFAQGSEFETVYLDAYDLEIALIKDSDESYNRLLYTGVSRSRKNLRILPSSTPGKQYHSSFADAYNTLPTIDSVEDAVKLAASFNGRKAEAKGWAKYLGEPTDPQKWIDRLVRLNRRENLGDSATALFDWVNAKTYYSMTMPTELRRDPVQDGGTYEMFRRMKGYSAKDDFAPKESIDRVRESVTGRAEASERINREHASMATLATDLQRLLTEVSFAQPGRYAQAYQTLLMGYQGMEKGSLQSMKYLRHLYSTKDRELRSMMNMKKVVGELTDSELERMRILEASIAAIMQLQEKLTVEEGGSRDLTEAEIMTLLEKHRDDIAIPRGTVSPRKVAGRFLAPTGKGVIHPVDVIAEFRREMAEGISPLAQKLIESGRSWQLMNPISQAKIARKKMQDLIEATNTEAKRLGLSPIFDGETTGFYPAFSGLGVPAPSTTRALEAIEDRIARHKIPRGQRSKFNSIRADVGVFSYARRKDLPPADLYTRVQELADSFIGAVNPEVFPDGIMVRVPGVQGAVPLGSLSEYMKLNEIPYAQSLVALDSIVHQLMVLSADQKNQLELSDTFFDFSSNLRSTMIQARKDGAQHQIEGNRLARKASYIPETNELKGRTFMERYRETGQLPGKLNAYEALHDYTRRARLALINTGLVSALAQTPGPSGQPRIFFVPTEESMSRNGPWGKNRHVLEQMLRMAEGYTGAKAEGSTLHQRLEYMGKEIAKRGEAYKKVNEKGVNIAGVATKMWHTTDPDPAVYGSYNTENVLKHIFLPPVSLTIQNGRYDLMKAAQDAAQFVKTVSLAASLFFSFAAGESAIGTGGLGGYPKFIFKALTFQKPWKRYFETRRRMQEGSPEEMGEVYQTLLRAGIDPMYTADPTTMDLTPMKKAQAALEYASKNSKVLAFRPIAWTASFLMKKQIQLTEWMFNSLFATLKIMAAEDQVRIVDEQRQAEGLDGATFQDYVEIATTMDNAFGGQNWARYWWANPRARQLMSLALLSPNWTLSSFNAAGGNIILDKLGLGPASSKYNKEFLAKVYWPGMVAHVIVGIPNALQAMVYYASRAIGPEDEDEEMAMFDDHPVTFMNPEGLQFHVDYTPLMRKMSWYRGGDNRNRRVYGRQGKQVFEVFDPETGWIVDPGGTFLRKLHPAVKASLELFTGERLGMTDYALGFKGSGLFGGWITGNDGKFSSSKLAFIAATPTPFALKDVGKWITDPTERDKFPLGLIMNVRRGEHQSGVRLKKEIKDLLDTLVVEQMDEPIRSNRSIRVAIYSRMRNIIEAAYANGLKPIDMIEDQMAVVNRRLYAELAVALEKEDEKEMLRIARGIIRMDGTLAGAITSINRKIDDKKYSVRNLPEDADQLLFDAFEGASLGQ